jgi:hypothetical protein
VVLEKELKNKIARVVSMALEDEDFGTFLERFDITPEDAFLHLYEEGLVDPETFEDFLIND